METVSGNLVFSCKFAKTKQTPPEKHTHKQISNTAIFVDSPKDKKSHSEYLANIIAFWFVTAAANKRIFYITNSGQAVRFWTLEQHSLSNHFPQRTVIATVAFKAYSNLRKWGILRGFIQLLGEIVLARSLNLLQEIDPHATCKSKPTLHGMETCWRRHGNNRMMVSLKLTFAGREHCIPAGYMCWSN